MLAKILPLLNRLIPSGIAKKALERKIPELTKYFAGSAGAGYGLESSIDFLREQFEPIEGKNLRADEKAAGKRVQQSKFAGNAIKQAGKTALGAGVAGAAASAIPAVIGNLFQNPGQQSQQAASPQSPKKPAGDLSQESLFQQFNQGQNGQENQQGNSLIQMAPDIAEEVEFDLANGITLEDAIENIKGQPQIHGKAISNLERNLKLPFAEIVKQFYKNKSSQSQSSASPGQTPQAQTAQGQGKQALAQTMQQITQLLKSLRGQGG